MTSHRWTIREVLDWTTQDFAGRGIASPRLDAELLVAKALGTDRVGLYLDLNRPLVDQERSAIRPLVARRREREPVAYILGHRDFYGRRFDVSPAVLIPRPDTETLVEHALECIPNDTACRVLDVGTGSGAVAVTIAAERPLSFVTATDISDAALEVASRNAERLEVNSRIRFERADLLSGAEQYDVIVSNPPYITQSEMATLQTEVREHEPVIALEAGEDGLDVVRALLTAAEPATARGAQMLIEIGAGQAASVVSFAAEHTAWQSVAVYPDLSRIERVVHLRRI
ncbi:MAG: peptide chain release factor N(5)-glutamine methyltransferase [Deltaproteobacteria bacterium]|nr:peptide chain release factor N(5)-glutamine methyltransferase [Deltaproteobacteria bacterium]MBW1874523.1 peptide chain release factor N(5)-glutamine methyltransferase [Deltaproteobacteria bacterium]MBW2210764.1 peptide chain release factor N(5)-glutamine methyltransferase [Deltaproteobacteria bacterium]MBW2213728.1 peptide chain release factor N(5)-glutamine methyltransferase [Deltaproteobacteria bacterium]MBW2378172.1 peptide chain release factor N(5)-glutamine methyltransferase [Deltaprot